MRHYFAIFGVVLALVPAMLYYNSILDARDDTEFASIYVLKNKPGENGFLGQYVAGTIITEDDLETLSFVKSSIEQMPWAIQASGAELPAPLRALLNQPLTSTVPAGSILQEAFFINNPNREFGMQIAEGMRAFSISVSREESVSGFVVPGSVVDVYPQASRDVLAAPPDAILKEVNVLAVGEYFSTAAYEAAGRPSYSNVTIELSPKQISIVLASRQSAGSELSLSLYNPCNVDKTSVIGCGGN